MDARSTAACLEAARKHYGPTLALDGVDLTLGRGEVLALLGANGAGKSTAIALLLGLRRIPLESQMLLELYYWEDFTAREIAEVVQIPEGTVRTRLRRAKQLLEQALAQAAESREVLETTLSDLEGWARRVRDELRPG